MRHAVGLILRRRGEHGTPASVYLAERRPELAFFGGYWAFVGGTVEEQDEDPRLAAACARAGAAGTGAAAGAEAPPQPRLVAAAARELFEETGVLLARPAGAARSGADGASAGARSARLDARALAALRTRLVARTARFADLLEDSALEIDAARLVPACRMITPPFTTIRYDTLFFLVDLEPDEEPAVLAEELVRGEFLAPRDALARWRRGERLIVPPGLVLLESLERTEEESAARFLAAARRLTAGYARGKIHPVRFSPGIQMATLHTSTHPPADHTNAYFVGEERVLVVDPGSDRAEEQEKLFEALDEVRAAGRRLEAIVLTHHHPDHVGAVSAVAARFGLPVWAHEETARALGGRIRVTRALVDGETLPLGAAPDGTPGWTLTVIHTPGHARGHLAFQESRHLALVVGDLVSTISTIVISPPEGHMATYLASLSRLRALPAGTICPAHGPARRDSHAVLDAALAHRARREEKVVAALGPAFRSLDEILSRAYDDVAPAAHALARRSLVAGLEKLVDEGRAEGRDGAYRLAGTAR
jgi:glyoxylase-like metal-dependent hydrolase (beta-lactamase superfamily II)